MQRGAGSQSEGKAGVNEIWKLNCSQMVAFDETITGKDAEIEQLTAKVTELEASLTSYRCRPCSVDAPASTASPHTNFSAR